MMKNYLLPLPLCFLAFCLSTAPAKVINDGTHSDDLLTDNTAEGFDIEEDKEELRISAKTNDLKDFRSRGIIYPSDVEIKDVPEEGLIYKVSADYKNNVYETGDPADFGWWEIGGVIGWYDPESKIGIGLASQRNEGDNAIVLLGHFDFTKGYSNGIASSFFRNEDGSLFTNEESIGKVREKLTYTLEFQAPTEADKEAWADVQSRVVATISHDGDELFTKTFLSGIEVPDDHRVGYLAGSMNAKPDTTQFTGTFDNLTLETAE